MTLRRWQRVSVMIVTIVVMAGGPATQATAAEELLEDPYVTSIDDIGDIALAYGAECPPELCVLRDAPPPENTGGFTCSWTTRTAFHGTRSRQTGAISGTWSGMYTTTDCVTGSHEPLRMKYMFIRASNNYGETTYQTAPARSCTYSSPQCSGLTSTANDAGCSPCNGWWHMTTTSVWRLPDGYSRGWGRWDESRCSLSSDSRQLDCQSTKSIFL